MINRDYIRDLDEAQGLTYAMVRFWILSHGWRIANSWVPPGKPPSWPKVESYNHDSGGTMILIPDKYPDSFGLACFGVGIIAEIEQRPVQSVLRDLNPRLRRGWPSKAALAAHGRWVWASTIPGVAILGILSSDDIQREKSTGGRCRAAFWPCDDRGNKIRWAVDSRGNML